MPESISDHQPILKTMTDHNVDKTHDGKKQAHWSYKKANWQKFAWLVEKNLEETQSIHKSVTAFNEAISQAANAAIPRGSVSKRTPWWCEEADAVVSECKKAKKLAETDNSYKRLLTEKLTAAIYTINRLKRESWEDFASNLSMRDDPTKVWKAIHSIDGKKQ